MGQMTFAIMLGVEETDEIDWIGLLGEWRGACADKIKAYEKKHPRKTYTDPSGDAVYVPASPYQAEPPLVGFYVAVGASGKAGVPYLGGFALTDVKTRYVDAYKAARRRWRRFAKWAASKGVAVPKARLFLTEAEVA